MAKVYSERHPEYLHEGSGATYQYAWHIGDDLEATPENPDLIRLYAHHDNQKYVSMESNYYGSDNT